MATTRGRPVLVPVTNVARQMPADSVLLDYRQPGSDKIKQTQFQPGEQPFVVTRGDGGAMEVVALDTGDGHVYPLDRQLTYVDLSDEERQTVLLTIGG